MTIKLDKFNRDSQQFKGYINNLKGKVYKVLPLYEEKELTDYFPALLIELRGMNDVFTFETNDLDKYVSLLCKMNGLHQLLQEKMDSHEMVRKIVFDCLNVIGGIGDKYDTDE